MRVFFSGGNTARSEQKSQQAKSDANSCCHPEFASSSSAVSCVFKRFSVNAANRAVFSCKIFTFMYLFLTRKVLISAFSSSRTSSGDANRPEPVRFASFFGARTFLSAVRRCSPSSSTAGPTARTTPAVHAIASLIPLPGSSCKCSLHRGFCVRCG